MLLNQLRKSEQKIVWETNSIIVLLKLKGLYYYIKNIEKIVNKHATVV